MIYRSPSVGQMVGYGDGRIVIRGGSSFVDLRDPRRRLGCLSVKHSAKPGSQDCQGVLTVESQPVSLGPGYGGLVCDGVVECAREG